MGGGTGGGVWVCTKVTSINYEGVGLSNFQKKRAILQSNYPLNKVNSLLAVVTELILISRVRVILWSWIFVLIA